MCSKDRCREILVEAIVSEVCHIAIRKMGYIKILYDSLILLIFKPRHSVLFTPKQSMLPKHLTNSKLQLCMLIYSSKYVVMENFGMFKMNSLTQLTQQNLKYHTDLNQCMINNLIVWVMFMD